MLQIFWNVVNSHFMFDSVQSSKEIPATWVNVVQNYRGFSKNPCYQYQPERARAAMKYVHSCGSFKCWIRPFVPFVPFSRATEKCHCTEIKRYDSMFFGQPPRSNRLQTVVARSKDPTCARQPQTETVYYFATSIERSWKRPETTYLRASLKCLNQIAKEDQTQIWP